MNELLRFFLRWILTNMKSEEKNEDMQEYGNNLAYIMTH
jgi:hypothetical protein